MELETLPTSGNFTMYVNLVCGESGGLQRGKQRTAFVLPLKRICAILISLKENSILMNEISENTSNEDLNKLLMTKIILD